MVRAALVASLSVLATTLVPATAMAGYALGG
jgi:hypothetical protein